jgi:prepilin-type N-terminal cleavage/methylation domain-containing protein
MLGKDISPGLGSGNPMDCGKVGLRQGRGWRGGFSLVEMLTVMAIISLLMAASNVLFRSPGSRAVEPAVRMARCIELARAQAVANNRSVAIRFDAQVVGSREWVLRFLENRPGRSADQIKEFRRPERFQDIVIAKDIVIAPRRGQADLPAPEPSAMHDLAPAESLVINSDGQVLPGTGTTGFPVAAEQLVPIIQLGVQPTRAGKVVAADKRDVAIIQIQCATGTARVLQP